MHKSKMANPPGLVNHANSCFQNSVSQALASLPPLAEYLRQITLCATPENDNTPIFALHGFINDLLDSSNQGSTLSIPPSLKMNDYDQQDAQEFLMKLTDAMEKDIKGLNARLLAHENIDTLLAADRKETETFLQSRASEQTVIPDLGRHPLQGHLAQRVGCMHCGASDGLTMTPFNLMTFSLGNALSYSLETCFDEHTSLELIEGVQCGKCTVNCAKTQAQEELWAVQVPLDDAADEEARKMLVKRIEALDDALADNNIDETTLTKFGIDPKRQVESDKSKQVMISLPPKCLIVHINRSIFNEQSYNIEKNYAEVTVPLVLDIGRWCLDTTLPIEMSPERSLLHEAGEGPAAHPQTLYNLCAVIVHQGRHENGHYITYRRILPERSDNDGAGAENSLTQGDDAAIIDAGFTWWELSDWKVRRVSENVMYETGEVYMAFYTRIEQEVDTSICASTPLTVPTA